MMRLRFIGESELVLRHRAFAPGSVTEFDMGDDRDAALAVKCSNHHLFTAADEPKPRGRPRKVRDDQDDA